MKCGLGRIDKYIRIILGVLIIGIGIYYKSWLFLLGIVPILTVITGRCPLCVPMRMNDQDKENSHQKHQSS